MFAPSPGPVQSLGLKLQEAVCCKREALHFFFSDDEWTSATAEDATNPNRRKLPNDSKFWKQLGPPLEVIQREDEHHRNSNAPTFADKDPTYTLWAEDGARKAAWQCAKKVVHNSRRRTQRSKLYSSNQRWNEWEAASTSTVNPDA